MPASRRLVRPQPSMRVLPVLLLLIAGTLSVLTSPPAQAAVIGPLLPVLNQSASGGILAFEHRSDLGVTLTSNPANIQRGAGTTVTQHLTVTNSGPYGEPDAVVTETLPAGATVVASTPSAGSCTTASVTVTCHLGAMTSGATVILDVVVRLDGSPRLATSVAAVTGANSDPTPADASATVTTRVNTAPVAMPDSTTTTNGSATFDPSGNDTDADPDTLAVTSVSGGSRGFVVLNTSGTVTYTAAAGQGGGDSFNYVVSDGHGGSDVGTVTVTIANRPPTAQNDTATTSSGAAVDIDVLANDTDPNIPTLGSQSLVVTSVTQPSGGAGTVTHSPSSVTFLPSGSFVTGTTTFDYTVSDGAGGTDTAMVTVTAANGGPQATNDVATTPYRTSVDVDVLNNDGAPLVLTGVSGAAHGSATVVNGQVRYVPDVGWSGSETLTYSIADTASLTDTGRLTVTTLNGAPSANGFARGVPGGRPTTIDVLTLASDPNGDVLVVIGAGPVAHGSVSVNGAGAAVYTPDPAYRGTDSFQYTVGDGHGGTATATVTLTVANQPPVLGDDVALVPLDGSVDVYVLANDTDANGDTLTVTGTSAPAHGTVTTNSSGRLTYRPGRGQTGGDSFSYTVDDGAGGTSTAQVQVTVPIRPPTALAETRTVVGPFARSTVSLRVGNRAPVPVIETPVLTGAAGAPRTIDVLRNDEDPDGDLLRLLSVGRPAHGTTRIVNGKVVYTPDLRFAGPDSFIYVVGDGHGGTATQTVRVTVSNRDPVAEDDAYRVENRHPRTFEVLANDSDPDGDHLRLLSVTRPDHGSAVIAGGELTYTAADGHVGVDSFGYTLRDARGGTATATVTVTVSSADATGTTDPTGTSATTAGDPTDPVAGVFEIVENGRSLNVLSVVEASDEPLPDTGGPAGWLPMVGFGLLFIGAGLLVGRRLAAGFGAT